MTIDNNDVPISYLAGGIVLLILFNLIIYGLAKVIQMI